MLTPNNFKDYELLDASNGQKLERWGKYILLRPDPTVIWDYGNLLEKYCLSFQCNKLPFKFFLKMTKRIINGRP